MGCCASDDILQHGSLQKFIKFEDFRVKFYGTGKDSFWNLTWESLKILFYFMYFCSFIFPVLVNISKCCKIFLLCNIYLQLCLLVSVPWVYKIIDYLTTWNIFCFLLNCTNASIIDFSQNFQMFIKKTSLTVV